MSKVAVIITCHNYGEYLDACIQSVLSQTIQATELVVVDDLSTDHTAIVASRYEQVKYLYVTNLNCFLSRKDGFNNTKSEFIIFLDGDDKLDPEYIEKCLDHFEKYPKCGVVTTNLTMFGGKSESIENKLCNIQQNCWAHASSMVRRCAIQTSGAYETARPPTLDVPEDWFVWRRVQSAGWEIGRVAGHLLHYRIHRGSLSTRQNGYPYSIRSHLVDEPLTLVIPLCRLQYVERLSQWISKNEKYFTDFLLIDSTNYQGEAFRLVQESNIRNIQHIKLPYSDGLEDKLREGKVYDDVQVAMSKVYNNLRRVTTEYMFILEDDVLPPDDCISDLYRHMNYDVCAISGVVPYKNNLNKYIAGRNLQPNSKIQAVDYSGFGCLLLRNSVLRQCPPINYNGRDPFDLNFFSYTNSLGYKNLLNWEVKCKHG